MFLSDVHTHTHTYTLQEGDAQVFANIQHLYQDMIDSLIVGDLIEHPITDIQGVIPQPANIKRRIDHLASIFMTSELLHYFHDSAYLFSFYRSTVHSLNPSTEGFSSW